MKDITIVLLYFIYALIVLGACFYAVFVLGHSGWWFAVAIIACSIHIKTQDKRDE